MISVGVGQLRRAGAQWTATAREQLVVKAIGSTMYAFGSELAILRIFYDYAKVAKPEHVRAFQNRGDFGSAGAWVLALELQGLTFGADWVSL